MYQPCADDALTCFLGFSDEVPAGYRKAQSCATLSFRGRCLIRNLYICIRYLKLNKREFFIFSRP